MDAIKEIFKRNIHLVVYSFSFERRFCKNFVYDKKFQTFIQISFVKQFSSTIFSLNNYFSSINNIILI